ncbi:PREDICTED: H/ACA ribonucleoprotein complex non-core subunit NAF1 isoform X2 [Tarenaya hassleriana]|uniref:H/ACA ribonucleoprotein complex non-core subunit NAF1 isoform X2 n=1 Tax=Tarenaya hassleriana TaxID=28532 RepID=UPI00053C1855|nr:PREDICTED: H/ACA ribonucleoprotein complex non-core subunit NAF1 isoform X2 [Tarenaya hassleriana]
MVGFPSKAVKTVEEERAEEIDQDPKMVEEGDGKETCVDNQNSVLSESIEMKSELLSGDTSEGIAVSSASVIPDESRAREDGQGLVVFNEFEIIESVPVASPTVNVDEAKLDKTEEGLACSIEEGFEKVSLAVDDDQKSDEAKNETNSSESEIEASSSSSSSSKSSTSSSCEEESDGDEEKKKGDPEARIILRKEVDVAGGELEEGEIKSVDGEEDDGEMDDDDDDDDDDDVEGGNDDANAMTAWSDDEDEEILGTQTKQPIRSKNELMELPPVPAVNATLEPHHAMLPVGVVLSVLGTQVIVEGVEKHNPLSEGSILWITGRKAPLGMVDEIFGPVKNPYYIVRFNSESEVPEGINQGTPVSFVAEFANHVLNDKNLYKKGYDASGENDEEMPEEVEFSDDEKEAEYRRMQKMVKRGMNEQKPGNTKTSKKKKNRDPGRHMNRYSPHQMENQPMQQTVMPNMLSFNHSDSPISSMVALNGAGMGNLAPHLQPQPQPQMGGFAMDNLGNRTMAPPGFLPKGSAWNSQANQQNQYQPPLPNQMAMPNLVQMHQMPLIPMQNQIPTSSQMIFQQQQLSSGQMTIPNMVGQGGQGGLNLFAGPPGSGPWLSQNLLNQAFGIGLNCQPGGFQGTFQSAAQAQPLLNPFLSPGFQPQPQQQRPHSHGFQLGGSSMQQGRKPPQRGGGRFGRGRGGRHHHQSG